MSSPIARHSLVEEAVQVLRDAIQRRQYGEFLLPERQLSQELGISRPTLRASLRQLEKEGLVSVNARQLRRVIVPSAPLAGQQGGIVRMLQNNLPTSFLNEHLQTQEFLAERLRGINGEFHVETAPGCFANQPGKALERLVRSRPCRLWILYRANEAMQRWFFGQNLKCVVLGSNHEGVDFVSIDQDYFAACRHGAGIFLGRGHRRLAILISTANRPGDRASCEGFLQGIKNSPQEDIEYSIAMHEETTSGVCKAVNSLLSKPHPPTGWLITNAQTYFTVVTYLGSQKLTVGGDVSLICRNSDPYLDSLVPSVAHYKWDVKRMNRRLLEIIEKQLRGGTPHGKCWLIPSQFCDGDSSAHVK